MQGYWRVALLCLLLAALPFGARALEQGNPGATECDRLREPARIEREVSVGGGVVDRAVVEMGDPLLRAWRQETLRVHYGYALGPCEALGQQYVWVYRIGGPYRVLADGQPLQAVEPISKGIQSVYNGRVPALFSLPIGAQRLEFVLEGLPFLGIGLADVTLGNIRSLTQIRSADHGALTLVNDTASLIIGLIGLLLLLSWFGRKLDRASLWFALACLLWALRGLLYQRFAINPWVLPFEQANPLLVTLTVMFLSGATLYSFGVKNQRWHRALVMWGLAVTLAFGVTLALERGGMAVRTFAFASAMLICLSLCAWLWRLHRRGAAKAGLLASGLSILLIGAMHDIGMVLGWVSPVNWSLLTPAFAVMLLLYGGVLFLYFLRQLRDSERANELLELRVEQKTRELEQSQALLREREIAQARAQERSVFQREMHDGLGSHLLATLRGLQRGTMSTGQMETALQEGLDEMRLIVNASDQSQGLFMSALAWRARWEPRLDLLGIELDWKIDPEIESLDLDVHATLQWLRVMQEAVTNVIKHAGADRIEVHWRLERSSKGDVLCLHIADNGRGVPAALPNQQGRGLANMRARAAQVGAVIRWAPAAMRDGTPIGTLVEMCADYSALPAA